MNLFNLNSAGISTRGFSATPSELYRDILKQPHTLICGATGSGKSVVVNGLIYTILHDYNKYNGQLMLIDPKRVELSWYKNCEQTIGYASGQDEIAVLLKSAVDIMEHRYAELEYRQEKKLIGRDLFIVIDEYADIKDNFDSVQAVAKIATLGRASGIHLICATQRCTRDIINGLIKTNIDSRLCLRVPTAQDSRNLINVKGAELLPRYGYGYYLTPETMKPQLREIQYIDDNELKAISNYNTPTKYKNPR